MAGIADLYTSLLTEVRKISAFKFVHIWNNQLAQIEDGKTYAFPFPNAFIEILVPEQYTPVGRGYSVGDLTIRIHIGHEEYDAGGGNYEENVNVFTLRDAVINKLNNFQPTSTSSLMKSAEVQDYTHTNVYHYIVEFKAAFIDSRGSYPEQHAETSGIIVTLDEQIDIVTSLESTFDETFDYTFN